MDIYYPKAGSRVGTAPPPTAQRNPKPGFSGFVMFVEVQPEAEKAETFIRAGRQQHQKLLHNALGRDHRRGRQSAVLPMPLLPKSLEQGLSLCGSHQESLYSWTGSAHTVGKSS